MTAVFPARVDYVLAVVADAYGVTDADLLSRRNRPVLKQARASASALLRSECGLVWEDVAVALGRTRGSGTSARQWADHADPAALGRLRGAMWR